MHGSAEHEHGDGKGDERKHDCAAHAPIERNEQHAPDENAAYKIEQRIKQLRKKLGKLVDIVRGAHENFPRGVRIEIAERKLGDVRKKFLAQTRANKACKRIRDQHFKVIADHLRDPYDGERARHDGGAGEKVAAKYAAFGKDQPHENGIQQPRHKRNGACKQLDDDASPKFLFMAVCAPEDAHEHGKVERFAYGFVLIVKIIPHTPPRSPAVCRFPQSCRLRREALESCRVRRFFPDRERGSRRSL